MNRRTVFLCSKALPKNQARSENDRDLADFRKMTRGMGGEEKLEALRQFVQNGAPVFLVFKIADGFQGDWGSVDKLFGVIRPLLEQAMEDEDDAES